MENSVRGKALVASPFLGDPNFLRTVVYMLSHDEDMALGLVLNRPTNHTIAEMVRRLDGQEIENADAVFDGGPVSNNLTLLQSVRSADGSKCVIFLASEPSKVIEICVDQANPEEVSELMQSLCEDTELDKQSLVPEGFRVFEGCASWGPGQLDRELEEGSWLVWDVGPDDIFGPADTLWDDAVREIGRDILASGIDPARIPKDPAFN